MSRFSVTLKIGGNWANGVTYVQQATIIVDGRTLKEVEEKAISMYCEDIIRQYGETNNLEAIYNNIDKTTEATCNTCGKCVCEWSITARARRMKKDESYKYARNYSGVRYCYNGFYKGYTQENICYVAYDPEYNKAEQPEAEATEQPEAEATEQPEAEATEQPEAEATEQPEAEATAQTTEATETKAEPKAEETEATAQTTETEQPDTAERGTIMRKYNIKVTACGVELNTLSNIPTSFTINKSFIIEAKDKEDAKQKGREKFIAETLYKGSIYGEYTGERRVAPFMEGFADDHSGKYEDITRRDYFEYRWQIDVFVKQYRKPRTKPEAEATAETTEATAQTTETTEATAETTEATTETTEATTETTEATTETTEETAQTTEATAEITETTSYPNKAMLNSYYGMCVTAPPPTETTGQTTEETPPPTGATPPPTGATPPTEATPPPTEATGKEVTGVTILEYRTYNNGDKVIIKHHYFYNADEIIDNYHATDPSYICKYKGLMFGKDENDYYVSEFHYEEQYL